MDITKIVMALLLGSGVISNARSCDPDPDPEPTECSAGEIRACPGNSNVGACKAGQQTCTSSGTWGACQGQVTPVAELCDGLDNDCDGTVDEGLTRVCYSGQAGTAGVGLCKAGVSTCSNGSFGACVGEVKPVAELCDNLDNDCDGTKDEGLVQTCYDGPPNTAGVGICQAGTSTCAGGSWGLCAGQVLPGTEVCDTLDQNCDGLPDDGFGTGVACLEADSPCGAGVIECTGVADPVTDCSTDFGGSAFSGQELVCGDSIVATTAGRPNNSSAYPGCGAQSWPGRDMVFAHVGTTNGKVSIALTEQMDADLDLLVLAEDCRGLNCALVSQVPNGLNELLQFQGEVGMRFYFVVDSKEAEPPSSYRITLTCE